jgi:hypothetical protein
MLITTSRRPGHRARILGRELARVIPNTKYMPRGVKTVDKLALMAESLGHTWVMVINSSAGHPKELRFLDMGKDRRWLDKRVELGEVKLQRGLGQRVSFGGTKIYAEGKPAQELATFLGEISGLPISEKLPEAGVVLSIITNSGPVHFQKRPTSEITGPVIQVIRFG